MLTKGKPGDRNRDAISIDSNRLLRLLGKLIAARFPFLIVNCRSCCEP